MSVWLGHGDGLNWTAIIEDHEVVIPSRGPSPWVFIHRFHEFLVVVLTIGAPSWSGRGSGNSISFAPLIPLVVRLPVLVHGVVVGGGFGLKVTAEDGTGHALEAVAGLLVVLVCLMAVVRPYQWPVHTSRELPDAP